MTDNRYLHLVRQDCPVPPGTHVVVYCRDSGGDEQDRSISQQVETAKEYCEHHHLILDHIYMDQARLSSNTEKRDALKEMLSAIRQQRKTINDRHKREKVVQEQPFGVIFWKSNRLGRDSIEATNIKTDLKLRAVTVIDLVTSANTGNTAINALIEAFQQWQDEQALDEISQNAKRGLAQLVATRDNDPEFLKYNPEWQSTGAYLGIMPGGVPTGFKSEYVQIGVYKRKKGRLSGEARIVQRIVPDPAVWDRAYMAWELRHQGAGISEIHDQTRLFKNVNGYTTFFANRIYTGTLNYGGKLYEGFVPAMISQEWFSAEQARKAQREQKHQSRTADRMLEPRRVASEYLLSGLVFCGEVTGEEHPMNIEHIPGKKGKRGEYTFFVCTTAKNSRNQQCIAKRFSIHALEQAVIDNLMSQVLTLEHLRPLTTALSKALKERTNDAGTRLMALEAERDVVQQAMSNIMDAFEKMGYSPHLQQRYDARKKEEELLVSEIARLKALQVKPKHLQLVTDDMLASWIAHLYEGLMGEDKKVARRLILQIVAKIVVRNGKGTLYYVFPFGDDVAMPSYGSVDLKRLELMTSSMPLKRSPS